VGHKPTGDCPAVLAGTTGNAANNDHDGAVGVEVVSADTSFSDTSTQNNRGQAIGIVEIVGVSPQDNHLQISGCLQDGTEYSNNRFHRLYTTATTTTAAAAAATNTTTTNNNNDNGSSGGDGTIVGVDESFGDPHLGKQWKDGWWIKALTNDGQYHMTRGEGRRVEYLRVEAQTVAAGHSFDSQLN